jgi:dTDP-4-amino-4,6-dideoxygalactose transaminase
VLAFRALKRLRRGRQVVLPAYTCPSVAAAVVRAELQPVLCDLRPDSFSLDLDHLASVCGPDTLAVVGVHLFGIPEDMEAVRAVTSTHGAFLVEDATQAFGNRVTDDSGSRLLGEIGDVGVWSFGRGKPLSVLSGGAVTASDSKVTEVLLTEREVFGRKVGFSELAVYGAKLLGYTIFFHPRLFWMVRRLPGLRVGETYFSLDIELKPDLPASGRAAAMAVSRFGEIRECRRLLERRYRAALSQGPAGLVLPSTREGWDVTLLRFPVVVADAAWRDRAMRVLETMGLGVTGMYPQALDAIPGFRQYVDGQGPFPRSASLARRLLTLPMHEHVTAADVDAIAGAIVRARHVGATS